MDNEKTREELVADQANTLRKIRLTEKKLGFRKPKQEKADRELKALKEAAIRRAEEQHRRRTLKLRTEIAQEEQELNLLKKRYLELSADVVKTQDPQKS